MFHVRRRFALALFQRRPSFAVWILLGLCVCEVRRRYNSIIMIRHEPIYFYDVVVIDCSIFHSVESADHFEFFTQSLAPSRFTELAYVLLDNWTIFFVASRSPSLYLMSQRFGSPIRLRPLDTLSFCLLDSLLINFSRPLRRPAVPEIHNSSRSQRQGDIIYFIE